MAKFTIIGWPVPLLVLLIALNNKVLIPDEVSNMVRRSAADKGDISPKALYPFDNISNFLQLQLRAFQLFIIKSV